ncbi:MAG: hypothetical protein ACRENN_04565 [Candidatus Eiseniibacteriota bacterium]
MRIQRLMLAALLAAVVAAAIFGVLWGVAGRKARDLERLSVQTTHPRVFLEEYEIAALKKLGLDDPIAALKSDLSTHGDMIQFESGVGGKMSFYDKAGIVFLPGRYVYAPAEDGHYLVHAILRYDVALGGKITWKLIDSHVDD